MSADRSSLSFTSVVILLEQIRPKLIELTRTRIGADLRSKFGASDVVQQTFLEAIREFPSKSFQKRAQFFGWIQKLHMNNISDACSRFRTSLKRSISKERSFSQKSEFECSVEDPLSLLIREETICYLFNSLELLPTRDRQMLSWRFFDGLTFGEIGEIAGCSEDCARMYINRCVEKLRRLIGSVNSNVHSSFQ